MARPNIDIDWVDFEKLCEMNCTEIEIANWFRCSVDTICRAVKKKHGVSFAEFRAQKADRGRVAIRRTMLQKALKGDNAMLIWLSKNYMNMADKVETKNDHKVEGPIVYASEWGQISKEDE